MRNLLITAILITTGCAARGVPVALTPLGREHVRPPYRFQLEGGAIVLPVLECAAEEPDLVPNLAARAWASAEFSDGVWQVLQLPEPTREGRIDESRDLCRELASNFGSGANVDDASPTMRERLRDLFNRYPDKSWLLAVTRYLRPGARVAGVGASSRPGAGALEGLATESDTLEVHAYVFHRAGDLAYRADLVCTPGATDPGHDCGPRYALVKDRIGELLDGFPRSILRYAAIVRPDQMTFARAWQLRTPPQLAKKPAPRRARQAAR